MLTNIKLPQNYSVISNESNNPFHVFLTWYLWVVVLISDVNDFPSFVSEWSDIYCAPTVYSSELNCVPPSPLPPKKDMLKFWNVTSFGNRVYRGNHLKMRSLGWPQSKMTVVFPEAEFVQGHWHPQWEDDVKTHRKSALWRWGIGVMHLCKLKHIGP